MLHNQYNWDTEVHAYFNLRGNYSTMQFTLGHVNGYAQGNGTLIFLDDGDNVIYTRELTLDMYPEQVTVDVTDVHMLRMLINPLGANSAFGLVNLTLAVNPYAQPADPALTTPHDTMAAHGSYQFSDNYAQFSAELSATQPVAGYFTMAGDPYVNGFTLENQYNWGWTDVYALFDLAGSYSQVSFTAGHLDKYDNLDANKNVRQLILYGDGVVLTTYDLTNENFPERITVDVRGVKQLKLYIDEMCSHTGYGFANVDFVN